MNTDEASPGLLCLYCRAVLAELDGQEEHLNIHKTLKPVELKKYSLSNHLSSKPVITSDPTTVCRHGGNDQ